MIDTKTPAFPNASDTIGHCSGLTIRQYFAAMAMQGILASSESEHGGYAGIKAVSEMAILYADGLAAALNAEDKG